MSPARGSGGAEGDNTGIAKDNARRLVLLSTAALGVSCTMTQLALLRELLGAFSGNEMVLGVALGLWLLLMGLGTWMGRFSERLRNPLAALALTQILIAILPLVQVFLLRALRNVVFIRGAEVGMSETFASAFVLLAPYCLLAGFVLTLACAVLVPQTGPAGIGQVYVADSLGSILGGIIFTFVLAGAFDHLAILVWPGLLNLLAAFALGLRVKRSRLKVEGSTLARVDSRMLEGRSKYGKTLERVKTSVSGRHTPLKRGVNESGQTFLNPPWTLAGGWLSMVALAAGAGLIAATVFADLDAMSTALQYPGQRVVARANSPYGKLIVIESAGQFDFIENGIPITSTRDDQHVEETVHYAMAQRPEARRVLLVSGGVSGTAREILKYNVKQVDYVELDPLLLEFGRRFLPENLADPRIHVINTDGRLFIKTCAGKYDVVIMDIPAPSTAQLNRFYTVEFLAEAKRALAKDGVLSFALGQYENYVSPELARMLASARASATESFKNVLMIPGGRVFFLASDGPLFPDIAARTERRQIKTRLVNRHYLDAMLAPDRMADITRATAQPAKLNQDFAPVLYYYHLRHWMSQFNNRIGPPQVGLLILFGLYVARLRGNAVVLFASGFAASAIEIVLLLAFQVLCGSVYHQIGIIVTVFMLGLALGAWMVKSEVRGLKCEGGQSLLTSAPTERKHLGSKVLALLALLIAAYAGMLPFLMPLLDRMSGAAGSVLVIKVVIAVLTLILAVLVGMQFPLANRIEFSGTARSASRLYTADFAGACLGALLACTLLIPLLGVAGVCALTAGLNLLAGSCILLRKIAI